MQTSAKTIFAGSYRASIDGREYHGRGFGPGMYLRLRASKVES